MKVVNWKTIISSAATNGLTLEVHDDFLFVSTSSDGIGETFHWLYSSRTEPSVLSRHSKDLSKGILIAPYIPLSIEKNLSHFCSGYFDEQGNYSVLIDGKLHRHRTPLTALELPLKHHDYFNSPNGNAAKLFRALLRLNDPMTLREFVKQENCSLGFGSQVIRFMKEIANDPSRSLPLTDKNKRLFLQAWRDSYSRYEEARYMVFNDPNEWIRRAENDPAFPFRLSGEYFLDPKSSCPVITFLTEIPLTCKQLCQFGLVEDPNGILRIKKASPYVLERFDERPVDEIEAYLTSFLPLSEN